MRVRAFVLLFLALACGGGERGNRVAADSRAAPSLVGAWDVRLSLTHPYPLGLSQPAARRICGTIGFVENHRDTGPNTDRTPNLGVYDLDLSQLGLDWLGENFFPTAVASEPHGPQVRTNPSRADSVKIVLNPGSTERIVLRGHYDPAGIDGDWVAQSARGTATGSFSLRPHGGARQLSDC